MTTIDTTSIREPPVHGTAPDIGSGARIARLDRRRLPLFLRILHWVLIANFVLNICYGAFQLFVVLAPEGGGIAPLFGAAETMPAELLLVRRAYATEVWLSITGLAIYLAITEYLPRLLGRR